jgi:hypothetical protein
VFVGTYDDPLQLTACRRTNTALLADQPARLIGPDDTVLALYHPIAARGSRLYLHTDTHILIADLADQPSRSRS